VSTTIEQKDIEEKFMKKRRFFKTLLLQDGWKWTQLEEKKP
jgi:hypothetical protein